MASIEPLPDASFIGGATADEDASARGWIASRGFDSMLLVSGPLIGFVAMLASTRLPFGVALATALAFLVGMPHYLSTFVFFLGDDQRAYYLTRPFAYAGGPLVILASVALLHFRGAAFVVFAAIFVWNIWHVSMQSAGVVSLYRYLAGGSASERRVAHGAILCTNAAMAFWFADAFEPLAKFTRRIDPHALRFLAMVLFAAAAVCLFALILRLRRRTTPVSFAEFLALAAGLLLFHPYLWVASLELATFGMLIGHFVQYLALVWLIQSRKYGPRPGGSAAQRLLSAVSARPWAIVGVILLSGAVVFAGGRVLGRLGVPMMYVVLANSLALVHFYLDGLIWAFKKPFVRQALGPYATVPSHRIAA